ncbi:bestrophin-2-like isoform X2 [Scylla paramamosain]|uniref:bestrophin-2-like isoform X2 n=1 Tax=Scylla paramamosain TaxID=85552 RepID=UPI00308379FA
MASTYIEGQDERGRMLRRSFARYINLAFALAFSRISPRVARRLSSYQKYIDAGYMTQDERVIFEMMDACSQHHKIWMPLVWASLIVRQARREGRCPDDHGQKAVVTEITNLRYNCGKLQEYHTMSVPLVYTQVVTLATYSYFAFSILGRQFLDPAQGYENHSIDFYVPIFTLFQFVFYVGWLKVAESLLNPFGDDDDDFETTEFLERHLEVSYMIVDNMHKLYPDVLHPPGTRDLAVPLNNVMARSRPVDSPPSKTASFSGQSEGEKSPVVKSLSQCCIQWRRRVSRSRRASPIRHNGDAYLDTYGAVKTPPVLHGISGRPGSPKCSATEQPFFVPSKLVIQRKCYCTFVRTFTFA